MNKENRNTATGKYWMIYPKSKEAKDWVDKKEKGSKFLYLLFPFKPDKNTMTAREALQKVIDVTGIKGFSLAYIDIHNSVEEKEA